MYRFLLLAMLLCAVNATGQDMSKCITLARTLENTDFVRELDVYRETVIMEVGRLKNDSYNHLTTEEQKEISNSYEELRLEYNKLLDDLVTRMMNKKERNQISKDDEYLSDLYSPTLTTLVSKFDKDLRIKIGKARNTQVSALPINEVVTIIALGKELFEIINKTIKARNEAEKAYYRSCLNDNFAKKRELPAVELILKS